ncbi:hypothetical protein QWJ34_26305 [Saccharibacillus sp. CPCC 101409]|uniref:hypothetical protein n=1 Tax=Saccharibacillus sp. CPCC 101409 TaxID=3058041 RepID=UPI0026712AEC|nr:hypothetical protein [Saccharibacillus sp. CPCC 101409]MDO3413292.1 hypothetical protein [Saccharibacillus sp. CPCC 101409]
MKPYLLLIGCLLVLWISGCQEKKPKELTLNVSDVQSIQVWKGMNTGVASKALDASRSSDQAIMTKVVEWFNEAEYKGEAQTQDTAVNSMPGSSMVITLTDGKEITLTTGTQTLLVSTDTPSDRLKIYNESLMRWLASGWKEDIGNDREDREIVEEIGNLGLYAHLIDYEYSNNFWERSGESFYKN